MSEPKGSTPRFAPTEKRNLFTEQKAERREGRCPRRWAAQPVTLGQTFARSSTGLHTPKTATKGAWGCGDRDQGASLARGLVQARLSRPESG